MRIGIGVTTHNRRESLVVALENIKRFMPPDAKLVVVDDASNEPVPEADFRFERNVGIAVAKNKCLELLDDCDHLFLFDDDCWPKQEGWWKPYVESPEPHLMYIFRDFAVGGKTLHDIEVVYDDGVRVAYSHTRGCMLYIERRCIDAVGGFDPIFGKWGAEHGDYSNRVFFAGLTTFPYMDVPDSGKLIHSSDEHRTVVTTVPRHERKPYIERNEAILAERVGKAIYVPYKNAGRRNVVLTCFFTGAVDYQRNRQWDADASMLDPLINSLKAHNVEYVILNDCFEDKPGFQRIQTGLENSPKLSPYWQRWIAYYRWLLDNPDVDQVWCVDGTDVEMLRNPFPHMEPGVIYTGDEQGQITRCRWMTNTHPHNYLRELYSRHSKDTLLNAGLLGGSRVGVMMFLRWMLMVLQRNRGDAMKGKDRWIDGSDMGGFNFVARMLMGRHIKHGPQVNTVFKKYADNGVAWWKHK